MLSPYKGGKQVSVGDIDVYCRDGHRYYTGFGSEKIYVSREMAVDKKAGEEVHITLRKASSGLEIIDLKVNVLPFPSKNWFNADVRAGPRPQQSGDGKYLRWFRWIRRK